jgi:hypothetical protein
MNKVNSVFAPILDAICPPSSPTNALQAIHAIALKKGFAAEDIMSIRYDPKHEEWAYTCEGTGEFFINLKPE